MRMLAPLLLLSTLGCTRVIQERELFVPRRIAVLSDRITRQNLEIPVEGGQLRGWMLRHPEARANVLYFTGNAEPVVRASQRLHGLVELLQANVLCVDYRGNGGSDGTPSLAALQQDALRIFDATAPLRGTLPTVAFSYSIGTWSAVHLAAHRPVAGVVLAAPFSAFDDMVPAARQLVPWFARPFVRLKAEDCMLQVTQPLQEMPRVKAPLLLLHGEADTLMRPVCSAHMHAAAGSAQKQRVMVPRAGHHDLVFTAEPMASALKAFLDGIAPAGPTIP